MEKAFPKIRGDLEFVPVRHEGRQLILIRDHLGLVQEGRAVPVSLYQVMAFLDGTREVREVQAFLIRQQGGGLVSIEEVAGVLNQFDEAYFLDSERFRIAKDKMIKGFSALSVRPCSHCGKAYPKHPLELGQRLDEIMAGVPVESDSVRKVTAVVSPHIDLSVGRRGYAAAYGQVHRPALKRAVVLGVGHQMENSLFSLTKKDFETPLGLVRADKSRVESLMRAGEGIVAPNDFAHRSEHSIEFQLLFLQHVLGDASLKVVPVLCGFLRTGLPDYSRKAYLERTKPFLETMTEILADRAEETLIIAGVDLSHVGPKFGHDRPALDLTRESEAHDRRLLEALRALDADQFWEESRRVNDRFNVCGFSALACLCEILPASGGAVLHYETWHEAPTRSAVSFAAVRFEEK